MNKEEKRILTLTATSHGLVHFFEGLIPPLIPLLLVGFNTNYFSLGLIVTVFSYAFGIGSIPAGVLSDRLGPRRMITFYLFGSSVVSLLVMGVDSILAYGVLMGLLGVITSVYHPASNAFLSFSISNVGQAFGINGIAGSLGIALVPIIAAGLATKLGWKAPHVLFGILAFILGVYSLGIRDVVHRPQKKTQTEGGNTKWTVLLLFFCTAGLLGVTYRGIMTFLPTYMGERVESFLGMGKVALGGTIATIALLSGAIGQYTAGYLVDRYRGEHVYLVFVILGGIASAIMWLAKGPVLIIAAVFYSFFYFATQPIQNFLLSRYISKARRGIGYGIHFAITFGIGSIAGVLGGYLADRFGLTSIFIGAALCFLGSAFFCLGLILKKTSI